MKTKIILITLTAVLALLLIVRFLVVDVVSVPSTSKCPSKGQMVFVSRWAYGYRLPWKATARWAYTMARRNDWVAYNRPVTSRDEKPDTTAICIGKVAAMPADTLWYNNDTGRISTSIDKKNGFKHPLIVPHRGKAVTITDENIQFYANTIMRHEPVKASIVDGQLCVSGKMVQKYTFQGDYYWMTTANPKDQTDSRTFGFVPHTSLIGKID